MEGGTPLASADLRLLSRFRAIVEAGGITPAAQQLGVTQSTLSSQLAALEKSLGLALCRRGRGGFRLTREGETIYRSAERLLGAVDSFKNDVAAARGEMSGVLNIGIVDGIAANPNCRLADAIADFRTASPDVQVTLKTSTPEELETGLLDAKYGIVLVPLRKEGQALLYDHIFSESQALYCGARHSLAASSQAVEPDKLNSFAYAGRGYLYDQTSAFRSATVGWDMESILLLVLSGHYIGHLPSHVAQPWEAKGDLCEIKGADYGYTAKFYCARRPSHQAEPVIDAFRSALLAAHATALPPRG